MSFGKENFLRTRLIPYFQQLDPSAIARWGEMDPLQAVGHFTDEISMLSGHGPQRQQFNTFQAAIGAMHEELIHFFEVFEKDARLKTRNPFFGELDFDGNIELLYRHGLNHLKQFGIEPMDQ